MSAPTNRANTTAGISSVRMLRGKRRGNSYLDALQGVTQGATQVLPSEGPFEEPCIASSLRPFEQPCIASSLRPFEEPCRATSVRPFDRILQNHLHQIP